MAKFLDDNGLSAVWAKIKEFCAGLMAATVYDPANKRMDIFGYVDETAIPRNAKYYPISSSLDIDTLTDSLMLVHRDNAKDCPVSGWFVYIMQIFNAGSGSVSATSYRTQIAWPYSSEKAEHGMAIRTYSSQTGTWSAWEKVYTDAAKPTAADVGARPSTWKPTPSDIVREGYTAAGLDPIAAAMIGSAASNKSFGLPAEAITVEYSNDGGATWEDYGASSSVKFALFAELRDSPIYLGKRSATVAADPANAQTTDSMLRVTIVPSDRYVSFNSIYCWLSTAGNKCQAKIESSTIGEKTTFSELKGWTTVSGWAGSNIIYFRSGTFGGGESQPTNHYAYRVTFRNTSINAVSGNAYINDIRFLGVDAWASPNNMVGRNRLYKWDALLNAIFERSVSGEQLIARAADGTPPLVVSSSTAVPKLNADLLDGKHAGDFASITRSATQPAGQRPGDYWDEILT
ncbi:hypothetical protein GMD88_17410 [Pseudoflavonifractor sp. BIOML-A6]|nr:MULTISPECIES: pyocin knob domain-containing protein [unclassified Pseudoflavonifractor]MTQ98574.1 hypothetical protein [Pseudoflavonifractor sp. BIOML-A16]MTR07849.1 hypothetical protein [Pseudoflavonifractor sp. BIOML-A15]MTR34040.1 hypothetical protein [Pseudoflavonifractor sp. BIOML-A14]MTR74798.1 hypothetical protein [Pseudoflavonifractor sp. BIOML-A18]MTS66025.1 hypothetical protein [Pseudoflavonifractor sp. BIOML-A5]MTS73343.1 hypothetical protein [Pseudoflavonifractor sp. BIOML-A8]